MAAIEPGESFEIEYGNNHRLTVVALNGRQRLTCLKTVGLLQDAHTKGIETAVAMLEQLEGCLKLCSPTITDAQIEKLDDELMVQIIFQTLAKQAITGEEAKKYE